MSIELKPEQRKAVETGGRVIVSASAGSGKTFVMIERLVQRILSGADIRNVLCVTFTNKAAAQMREKLRTALLNEIARREGKDCARLKAQLNALPLADISTIHAFCARLIRTYFFALNIDPSFRIISPDDAEGKTLSARAINETFDNAYERGEKDFSELLAVYFRKKKDARLRGIVLSLLSSVRGDPDYRTVLCRVGEEDLFEKACASLFTSYRSRARFLLDGIDERGAFFAEKSSKAFEVCRDLVAACERLLGAKDLFEMAALANEPLFVHRMPSAAKATGEEYSNLKFLSGASKAVKALYGELKEYGSEEKEKLRYDDAQRRAHALAALALEYDEIYTRLKREANVLDYDDLEQFALKILSGEEMRKEISEKYRLVFVDEYQDVNPVQESILFSVAGSEVFLVGDEKQAIYGFRGSRSAYFEKKKKELENSLSLTFNFRSAPAVLEAVNRVFSPLFGESYAPMQSGGRYGGHAGSVRFHWVREEEEEEEGRGVYSVLGAVREKMDVLAEQVADLVTSEYGTSWYDVDSGEERSVTYGDIAVLARKNEGVAERIVQALAGRGIPVTASSRVNICECFEVRLLIDWLSLLDNAEQDLPYASALLSGIGSFTEEELAKIRLRFSSPFTFREACREYEKKMADPLAKKLKAFTEKLGSLRMRAQMRTAAETLGDLLAEGLEAQIAALPSGRVRLARVHRFVCEAENAGSVHAFLARLKAANYRVDFSQSAGDEAVKVLTMHASKGLEYPVVILAGLDTAFREDHDEVLWTDEFHAAPKSYDEENKHVFETVLRRAAKQKQSEETIRDESNLLYVAMTRAKYRMHLLFGSGEHALSPRYAKCFSDFFDFPALADYFTEEPARELPPIPRKTLAGKADDGLLKKLRAVYEKEYPFEESTLLPVKSSATAIMNGMEKAPYTGGGAKGYTADVGTAYHAFLQHAAFGADAKSELVRMKEKNLLTEEQLALLDENKLAQILEIPCLKALKGRRVLREQTFLVKLPANEIYGGGAEDDIVFQGAIDLLAEDENGYTIIDYKFSSHDDARIRSDYAPQIKLYKKAVSRALKIDENTVRARIVNIALGREIEM